MPKTIPIKAKGTDYLPLKKLKFFQGNLKELKRAEFEKLRSSILKYGFRIPVFTWKENIIDGHQRIFVLNKLIKEGYTVEGDIPTIEIVAKDKSDAKKILLLINARYGKMSYEGLYEFLNDTEIDPSSFLKELDLPEIDPERYMYQFHDDIDTANFDETNMEHGMVGKAPDRGYRLSEGLTFRLGRYQINIGAKMKGFKTIARLEKALMEDRVKEEVLIEFMRGFYAKN